MLVVDQRTHYCAMHWQRSFCYLGWGTKTLENISTIWKSQHNQMWKTMTTKRGLECASAKYKKHNTISCASCCSRVFFFCKLSAQCLLLLFSVGHLCPCLSWTWRTTHCFVKSLMVISKFEGKWGEERPELRNAAVTVQQLKLIWMT